MAERANARSADTDGKGDGLMNSQERAGNPRSSSQQAAIRRADALSLGCWTTSAIAAALCMPPFEEAANTVFMIGPAVIAPAGYTLALLLASLAAVLMAVAFLVRRSTSKAASPACGDAESAGDSREDDSRNAVPRRRKGLGRAVRRAGNGLATCAIVVTIAIAGLFCLISEPHAADPPSNAGDRIVVVERNVLLSGYGTVYFVPYGTGCGYEIARYSADDGYSPMTFGTYSLSWQGRTPTFEAQGTPADPVSMYATGQ